MKILRNFVYAIDISLQKQWKSINAFWDQNFFVFFPNRRFLCDDTKHECDADENSENYNPENESHSEDSYPLYDQKSTCSQNVHEGNKKMSNEKSRVSSFDYGLDRDWASNETHVRDRKKMDDGHNSSTDNDNVFNDKFSESDHEKLNFDPSLEERYIWENPSIGIEEEVDPSLEQHKDYPKSARRFNDVMVRAKKIFEILQNDDPGFDFKLALDELELELSWHLIKEVFILISKSIDSSNKIRTAKLAWKFFGWSSQQKNYRHTSSMYNFVLKIFADSEEFKPMWRLVDLMNEKGLPTTARTFNILIRTCNDVGIAKKITEKFIKSKTFNYRPYRNSYNAIIHSLIMVQQYRLIEWVYQRMREEGYPPDTLTYNSMLTASYRLGNLTKFWNLLLEMEDSGIHKDNHTYNILLQVLGTINKPSIAHDLLNYMDQVGCHPTVLHFTSLIDGLSRAGNLDECQSIFNEMVNRGCVPDVVTYTVMITSYTVAGDIDKAKELFDEMIVRGQLPNVFTYNSMIRALCVAEKFEEAHDMLKDMESKGCKPNFLVYRTIISKLQDAGRNSEAQVIINQILAKGIYTHLIPKIKNYRKRGQ